jgi:hypothetical protein
MENQPGWNAMFPDLATLGALLVAFSIAVVLVVTAFLFLRLKNRGQLNRMLLRTVVDAKSREAYLMGTSALTGAFLLMGLLFALTTFGILDRQWGALLTAVAFGMGTAAIVFQVRISRSYTELPLEDLPELQSTLPQILEAATTPEVYSGLTPSPLYDQFALDQARFEAHRRMDEGIR